MLDVLDFQSHKVRTTVKAPLGRLVVAGGMPPASASATQPADATPPQGAPRVLWLLVRVTAEAATPAPAAAPARRATP